jgi:peptidoglycan/xylan/chitin deacetylase (PgdA/CDA1 family)
MKNRKQILLTFDFELFLGSRSGTVDQCLIIPSIEALKVVKKYNMKTIFFVDTLYLHKLREVGHYNSKAKIDYQKIVKLLRNIIDEGGYIFHHLHPHWLDAVYLEEFNEWDVSNKTRFALNNLSAQEVDSVFEISNEIILEIYSDKRRPSISGFRAGGLYAQPISHFQNSMFKFNIRMDFSVLKNAKSHGSNGLYGFDFSVFPHQDIYKFSNDLIVNDEKGDFIEIMMDQLQLKGLNKIRNGIYYRLNKKKTSWKRWGNGQSSGNLLKSTTRTNRFSVNESFSIELLNTFKARLYFNNMKKNHFLHIISHPKLFSPNSIYSFDLLLQRLTSKYELESDVFKILKENNIHFEKE